MSDALTPDERRLLSEVGFKVEAMNERLDELKKLLFGEHADGFMYRFARIEPDIEKIPEIKEKLDAVVRDAEQLSKDVKPLLEKVEKHDDYIKTQTIAKTLIVIGISAATSAAVTILTIWTLYNTLVEQLTKRPPTP